MSYNENICNEKLNLNFNSYHQCGEEIDSRSQEFRNNDYNLHFSSILRNKNDRSEHLNNNECESDSIAMISNVAVKEKDGELYESMQNKHSKCLIKLEIINDSTKRWWRQLDRKAFEYLSKELVKIGMNMNSFLLDYHIETISHVNKRVKWEFRNVLLKKVILNLDDIKQSTFCIRD